MQPAQPTADEILATLAEIRSLRRDGYSLDEALERAGFDELTYYRYSADYGALAQEQVRRLRRLEIENVRLRRAVSNLMLDKLALEEAAWSVLPQQQSAS